LIENIKHLGEVRNASSNCAEPQKCSPFGVKALPNPY
jgi:hypothetical protein